MPHGSPPGAAARRCGLNHKDRHQQSGCCTYAGRTLGREAGLSGQRLNPAALTSGAGNPSPPAAADQTQQEQQHTHR